MPAEEHTTSNLFCPAVSFLVSDMTLQKIVDTSLSHPWVGRQGMSL